MNLQIRKLKIRKLKTWTCSNLRGHFQLENFKPLKLYKHEEENKNRTLIMALRLMRRIHTMAYKRMAWLFPEYEYSTCSSALLLTQSCSEQYTLLLKAVGLIAPFWKNGLGERWSLLWYDCSRYLYAKWHACLIDRYLPQQKAGRWSRAEKPTRRTSGRSENYARMQGRKSLEVKNTVWYNYRRVPRVDFGQEIVLQGTG